MGRFINEIKKRGAYLYGSQELGCAGKNSDWDWAIPYSSENEAFLKKCGFRTDYSYDHNRVKKRVVTKTDILKLPGFAGENFKSFRKGNTNVIMMTPLLLKANQYATKMMKAYEGKGLASTKEGRVSGYQMYSLEYVSRMPNLEKKEKKVLDLNWSSELGF